MDLIFINDSTREPIRNILWDFGFLPVKDDIIIGDDGNYWRITQIVHSCRDKQVFIFLRNVNEEGTGKIR